MQFLEEQSSLSCEQRVTNECGWAETEYADFISGLMRKRGLSFRDMEKASGRRLTKSRLGRILHKERAERSPIKLGEVQVLLELLQVEYYQAVMAIELIKRGPPAEIETFVALALVLSNLMKGLPQRMMDLATHIDGLELDDIEAKHGLLIQEEVLATFEQKYRGLVDRREQRLARKSIYED